jgi:hypothetical protein
VKEKSTGNKMQILIMYAKCSNIAYKRKFMPLLQVRDMPEDLYEKLATVAKAENRSIAQETIVLLRTALDHTMERIARRRGILEELGNLHLTNTESFPNPAELIKEDRDR